MSQSVIKVVEEIGKRFGPNQNVVAFEFQVDNCEGGGSLDSFKSVQPLRKMGTHCTSPNNQSMFASQISQDIVKDLLILQSKLVGHTGISEIEQVFNGIENVVAKLHTL